MTSGITRVGLAGAVLVTAGLAAATMTSSTPPPERRTLGEETILSADFHVHAFPGDGVMLPWDRAREAGRRGLDAIAITAHNQMVGINATWPRETPFGVLLIPGEEVTMPDVHIAAIGLEHPVNWRGTIAHVVDAIHAQGGVAIAAHPAEAQRAWWTNDALARVDGIEVAHPMMFSTPEDAEDLRDAYAQALVAHPGIAAIGSSDDHTGEPIGLCRTYVFARARTTAGVIDAIRRGRTVACDAAGVVRGPAQLAVAVANACRADAAAGQTSPTGARLATALAWIGLVALAFFGFA
jgi:predicted metal-dependent phosphoesterase TrpH